MARRRGTWFLGAFGVLLGLALVVVPTANTAPAGAEPSLPVPVHVQVQPRDTVAIMSWHGGSPTDFLVELATAGSPEPVRLITTSTDVVALSDLTPATTYYARVRALGRDGTRGTPTTPVSFTTAELRYPLPAPVLEVDSHASTSLEAHWSPSGEGVGYEVELAKETTATEPRTKTVPGLAATFGNLKTDTTYSLRVRAVDATGQAQSEWSKVISRKTAASLPMRAGTFNVKKWTQANWSKRRTAVAQTILDADLDVVGLQEATPSRVKGRVRQFNDIVNLLGSDWALTDNSGGAPGETRIAYNRSRLELVREGHHTIAGSSKFGVARYVVWGIFEQKSTRKRFVFATTHFAYQKSAAAKRHRASAARQLVAAIDRVNTDNLPVIIGGDFNSGGYRNSGNAVYRTITGAGYIDPLAREDRLGSAERRINANLKTVHRMTRRAPRDSWAPMIDHVFVSKMRVEEWETVARLDSAGRFVGTIPSDHNLVRVTVYLP